MGRLFSAPKPPPPQLPPPVPQVDEAAKVRDERDRRSARRQAATTVLTGDAGLPNLGVTKTPGGTS